MADVFNTARTHRVSLLAIHGVGNHPLGSIADLVRGSLAASKAPDHWQVSEFNWDQFVRKSDGADYNASRWALGRVSASGHAVARLAVTNARPGVDAWLSEWQGRLCGLLQVVSALVFTALFAAPLLILPPLLLGWMTESTLLAPAAVLTGGRFALLTFALILAAIVAIQIVLGALRVLATRSLAPGRGTLASVALSLLTPLLVVLSIPVVIEWGKVWILPLFVSAVVGVPSLVLFAFGRRLGLGELEMASLASTLRYVGAFWAVLIAVQLLHWILSTRWVAGPVKVVVDILRYLGEPGYRKTLLVRFGEAVRSAYTGSDDGHVVLLTHSLGSIIALDWLANANASASEGTIDLVTMGSPYRRLRRWLPGVLFDLDPVATADQIARLVERFRWLNVYRPWDYVGRSLHLAKTGLGLDRSSGEWLRLDGHSGYWNDDAVLDTIVSAMSTMAPYTPSLSSPGRTAFKPAAIDLGPPVAVSLSGAFFKGYIAALCLTLAASFLVRERTFVTTRQRITTQGQSLSVIVTHHREYVGEENDEVHHFEVTTEEGRSLPTILIAPVSHFASINRKVDYRALVKAVRGDCEILPGKYAWYVPELSKRCRANRPLQVIVSRTDPSDFVLPCCAPKFSVTDVTGLVVQTLFLGLWFSMPFAPAIYISMVIWVVLSGLESRDDWEFEL